MWRQASSGLGGGVRCRPGRSRTNQVIHTCLSSKVTVMGTWIILLTTTCIIATYTGIVTSSNGRQGQLVYDQVTALAPGFPQTPADPGGVSSTPRDGSATSYREPGVGSHQHKTMDTGKQETMDTVHQETMDTSEVSQDTDPLAQYQIYSMLYENRTTINCTPDPGVERDFTIVTALYNLNRQDWPYFRRKFDNYLHYAVQLMKLNAPLVIYGEKDIVPFVKYYRRGKEHMTKMVIREFEELEYYKDAERVRGIMESDEFKDGHPFITHPEGFSPDYNIMMNSKFALVFEAARMNYFHSDYILWVDMGYGHGNDVYPRDCNWSPSNIMNDTDKITYIQLNDLAILDNIYDLYKKRMPPFVNGGFFGGSPKAIEEYFYLHKLVFEDMLDKSMVDDDQTVVVACWLKKPSLFNMVEGWWYDAFKLFH